MCSAATISEGKSISMPPNSSGMVMPVRPSSADFRSTARAAPGCLLADGGKIGLDFVGPELIDHAADRKMLLREIFWSEHLGGEDIFKEKS